MLEHKAVPAPRSHNSRSTDGEGIFLQTGQTGFIQLHIYSVTQQQVLTVQTARYLVAWETPRSWPGVYTTFPIHSAGMVREALH